MNRTRRWLLAGTAAVVVAAWALLYVVVVTTAPLAYDPATESAAKANREFALLLVVPTALWVTAALLVVDRWWAQAGVRLSGLDLPGRVLAAAGATLPDHRRDWGLAMAAELAEVRGRPARWRFALSSARVAVFPPGGGRVAVAVTGVLAVLAVGVAAAGTAAVLPAGRVFALVLVGLLGGLATLAVARPRGTGAASVGR